SRRGAATGRSRGWERRSAPRSGRRSTRASTGLPRPGSSNCWPAPASKTPGATTAPSSTAPGSPAAPGSVAPDPDVPAGTRFSRRVRVRGSSSKKNRGRA
ncbi:MAG: hypothetical protein F4Z59_05510, partial [Gemmatimonadales bacterium]|nr:hypothetical protein [Gemmatimonadales bacterium]